MTDFRRLPDNALQVEFFKAFFSGGEFGLEILRRRSGDLDWNGFLADHPEIARRPWEQVVDRLNRFDVCDKQRLEAIRSVVES